MGRAAAQVIVLIERVVRCALGLLLIAMVLLNAAAAGARYLFGDGLVGSDELMIFAMVWVVFIGAALLEREGRHLNFDLLLKRLPDDRRHLLCAVIGLLSAVVLIVVAWQSLAVVERLGALGQISMAGGMPMTVPHAALLTGLGLAALASLGTAARSLAAAHARGRGRAGVKGGAT